MGEYTRTPFGSSGKIRCFKPDDTADSFYLDGALEWTLQEIFDKAKDKWGDTVDINKITIWPEYIHTDCIGYDKYDPGDYTNYLRIFLKKD